LAVAVLLILSVITDGSIEAASMRRSDQNMSRHLKYILLFLAGLLLCSCTGYHIKTTRPKGVYHRVKSGDTLWNIARAYRVNIQDLAEVNNITDPKLIEVDSIVFIPSANHIVEDVMRTAQMAEATEDHREKENGLSPVRPVKEESRVTKVPPKADKSSVKDVTVDRQKLSSSALVSGGEMPAPVHAKSESEKASTGRDRKEVSLETGKVSSKQELEHKAERVNQSDSGGESERIKFDRERFVWPVKGKVRSKFGIQPNGMYYNGIRISAREGTPVLAAAAGTIIFSAPLKDYGETIIIKHEEHYATVYTHLSSRMVKVDDQVKRGNRIATTGQSSGKSDAYINFEIRYRNKARNPLFFLP
jgi:lipoprotein NlpD